MLFLVPSCAGKGGIQRFNRTVVHACSTPGMRVTILSIVDTTNELESLFLGPTVTAFGSGGSRLKFVTLAIWLLASRRWDLVFVGHVNLIRFVAALLPWTPSSHARTLVIAHGIDVWNCLGGSKARAVRRMWRVLAVSEYTRQSVLAQVRGLTEARCVLFPNALSESWKEQQNKEAECDFRLPEKFVLSVTRLANTERYKGIVTAIESMAGWDDRELAYVVVGGGNDLDFMKRVARRCDVAHRVIFVDSVSDDVLRSIYRRAKIFLLPSGKEGFGIVFLEAMYFSVPVIAARARGSVDVARDRQTALLVDFGDVIGISKAINLMSSDVKLCGQIVSGGAKLVEIQGEFTEYAMGKRWQEILGYGSNK